MNKEKHPVSLILYIFKVIFFSFFLVFRNYFGAFMKDPVRECEEKSIEQNKSRSVNMFIIICIIFAALFYVCSFFGKSKHAILSLDIIFYFTSLILFLFKTYPKYLPSVR